MTRGGGAVLLAAGLLVGGCALGRSRPSDPLSAEEHNDLGVAYYARGQHALATREFERALALRPDWTRARVNLGDGRLALGERDAAIAAYEAAWRASPDDPAIANNLAWALLQHAERWREAEPVIRAALARDPRPRGYYLDTLGMLLLHQGEVGGALEAFRAALADQDLHDRTTRALVARHAGQALVGLGDLPGAARCDHLAVALSVENVGDGDTVC